MNDKWIMNQLIYVHLMVNIEDELMNDVWINN